MTSPEPYLLVTRTIVEKKWNPEYGDERICKCGHKYYRHFDTYEDMEAVGCKYCDCYTFEEANGARTTSNRDEIPRVLLAGNELHQA